VSSFYLFLDNNGDALTVLPAPAMPLTTEASERH